MPTDTVAKPHSLLYVRDPLVLARLLWPDVKFYRQQEQVIRSVWENDETLVPAGNMLGKDFVAGFVALAFFLTRTPCRVVTTSADHSQLEAVLWGEIRRFVQTSRFPLDAAKGGPLVINHLHIRRVWTNGPNKGELDPLSYMVGRVAAKGEGMLGHHVAETGDGVPRTLFVADEASGVDDLSWDRAETWAKRKLAIGNPYPCNNFFRRGVKGGTRQDGSVDPGGDVPRPSSQGNYRKVIRIRGDDSPNVRAATLMKSRGIEPDGRTVLPGVLPWNEYEKRRSQWDKIRQCISLDAEFYDGAESLMFPPEWLNRAEDPDMVERCRNAPTEAIGIDPAEGGDKTALAAVNRYGVKELKSLRTPNTDMIPGLVLAFMRKHGLETTPERVCFDRGGGGKQHADRLRGMGYAVRTVGFGESVALEPKRGMTLTEERRGVRETRYEYKNRRAQMYGILREKLDPGAESDDAQPLDADGFPFRISPRSGFAVPREYSELRRQLAPIPLTYDGEGRLYLLPKSKKTPDSTEKTLTDLIGCSPDDADAVVLALFAMTDRPQRPRAGVL